MVVWKIQFGEGPFGWQVMNNSLALAQLYDAEGSILSNPGSYTYVSEGETPPFAVAPKTDPYADEQQEE